MIKKNIFLYSYSLLFGLCFSSSLWAQILIEEGKVVLSISPQEKISNTITVHNTSAEPMTVRAYWEDFKYQPPFDGKKVFLPAGTTENSMTRWVQFSPQEFSLAPFTKKKVSYTISVPKEVQGGYYGVFFFEQSSGKTKEATGVTLVTRVGSLFFLEAKEHIKSGQISDLEFKDHQLTGSFLNKGNVTITPRGVFYFMDKEGLVIDRGEIQQFYLPSGQSTVFMANLSQKLSEGTYNLVLTFDLMDGAYLVKEVDFSLSKSGEFQILNQRD